MSQLINNEKLEIETPQEVYDAFNTFIFSNDTKVFGKMVARSLLLKQTLDVPGDIVECGVFKGSGLFTWLKLKRVLCPNALKKIIGFDYFDTASLVSSLSGLDAQRMSELFSERDFTHEEGAEQFVRQNLLDAGFSMSEFELVKGDTSVTSSEFVARRPGMKISLLYMDLDLAACTYNTLASLWPRVSKGGLVVFDEYGVHQWSESAGADKFFEDKGVQIKTLDYFCPTAYVRK